MVVLTRTPPVVRISPLTRYLRMTNLELLSLREVAKGFNKGPVPHAHAVRLLELELVYCLLGDLRITTLGRRALNG